MPVPAIEIIPNWHPLLVHFTIALLLTSAALFVGGVAFARRPLGAAMTLAARWNLVLGVAATFATLATGWQAYNVVRHDEPSHANMVVHMRWAFGAAALFSAGAVVAWLDRRRPAGASVLLLAFLLTGSGALAVTGWLGGENVYRYGLGVLSLPKGEGEPSGDVPATSGHGGHAMPDSAAQKATSPGAPTGSGGHVHQ